jgi:hypothetical protein
LLIALLIILIKTLRDFSDVCGPLLNLGVCWYASLSAILGLVIWMVTTPIRQAISGKLLPVGNLLAVMFVLLLCYLLIASFGYGVFQYIPAGKGGGDFTRAGLVKLEFSADTKPPQFLFDRNPQQQLELILATDTSVFVANPYEKVGDKTQTGIGPAYWRKGRRFRPRVVEFSRSSIATITYLNTPFKPKGETPLRPPTSDSQDSEHSD